MFSVRHFSYFWIPSPCDCRRWMATGRAKEFCLSAFTDTDVLGAEFIRYFWRYYNLQCGNLWMSKNRAFYLRMSLKIIYYTRIHKKYKKYLCDHWYWIDLTHIFSSIFRFNIFYRQSPGIFIVMSYLLKIRRFFTGFWKMIKHIIWDIGFEINKMLPAFSSFV